MPSTEGMPSSISIHRREVFYNNRSRRRLRNCGDREGVLGTAALLATIGTARQKHTLQENQPNGLHAIEAALHWPGWLIVSDGLSELWGRCAVAQHKLDAALRPHGWRSRKWGPPDYKFSIEPDSDYEGTRAVLTAEHAADLLCQAKEAIETTNYATALQKASEAVGHCGESQAARLIMGQAIFYYGIEADEGLVLSTAEYLVDLEVRLQKAMTILPCMLKATKRCRDRWYSAIDEHLSRFCTILQDYEPVLTAARSRLQAC